MRSKLSSLVFGLFLVIAQPTTAQSSQKEYLDLIASTADRICGIANTGGSSLTASAQGQVKAEINSLVRRLADIGGTASGSIANETYDNVLRSDLPGRLQSLQNPYIQCASRKATCSATSVWLREHSAKRAKRARQ